MTPIIRAAAAHEPAGYWAEPSAASIQLNLDYRAEGAADAEAKAKAWFEAALARFETVRFAPYRRQGNSLVYIQRPDRWLPAIGSPSDGWAATAGGPRPDLRQAIIEWLSTGGVNPPRWATSADTSTLTDAAQLAATHRLAGAEGWPTPVPQAAALTWVVDAGAPFDMPLYLVPQWPEGDADPVNVLEIMEPADSPVVTVMLDGVRLELMAATKEIDASLRIDDTGFIRPVPDAAATFGLLGRLAQRSGSLFWAAPQFVDINWGEGTASLETRRRRLVWQGLNGCLALLDPVVLALRVPGTSRDGPFIAALNAEVARLVEDRIDQPIDLGDEVAEALRSAIATALEPSAAPGDARRAFADLLIAALGLDRAGAQAVLKSSGPGEDARQRSVASALAVLVELYRDHDPLSGFDLLFQDLPWLAAFEQQLKLDLAAALQRMASEAGIEAALLAILDHIKAATIIDGVFAKAGHPISVGADAMASLRDTLATDFDGRTAADQAVGELVQRIVARAGTDRNPPTIDEARALLEKAAWFTRRLRLASGDPAGALDPLVQALPSIGDNFISDADGRAALASALAAADAQVIADLMPASGAAFVADTEPATLPVMIAVDQDLDDDGFQQRFDGIGLLVRTGDKPWAHANLMRTTRPLEAVTLQPVLPVASDGFSQLFVQYNGEPFAWGAAWAQGADGVALPIVAAQPIRQGEFGAFAPLPPLAYGIEYDLAAFAVSRSGAHPKPVSVPQAPWQLDPAPAVPDERYVTRHSYRRRTAITGATFSPAAGGDFPAVPVGVRPLALDYPRLGVAAERGATRTLVLQRSARGGELNLLADAGAELKLEDVRSSGAPAQLTLTLEQAGAAGPKPAAQWSAAIAANASPTPITIKWNGADRLATLKLGPGWSIIGEATAEILDPTGPFWLRLELRADAAASGGLSLPEPAGSGGASPARPVMVAPANADWLPSVPAAVAAQIGAPMMSLTDFDRWIANPALKKLADGAAPSDLTTDFLIDLRSEHFEADASRKIAAAIPDLAVTALVVDLCPLDALGTAPAGGASLSKMVGLRPLGEAIKAIKDAGKGETLAELLAELALAYRWPLEIRAGTTFGLKEANGSLIAEVPPGGVARISVRPLVADAHFNNASELRAFDPRMLELSVGRQNGGHLFEGPSLVVEAPALVSLPAEWQQTVNERLAVRFGDTQRGYHLSLEPPASSPAWWRQFGRSHLLTQRWRYLGRPINHWFSPQESSVKPAANASSAGEPHQAVRRLAPAGGEATAVRGMEESVEAILKFERHAFAGRRSDGTEESTSIEPAGAATRLADFSWDQPGATMLRHRVTLESRYAPLFKEPRNGRSEVYDGTSLVGDWLRTVVLADPSAVQMTRPQLRALVPLSVSIGDIAPPVLAMLEEPPFGAGGLAERIGAEIRTGLGYRFENRDGQPVLGVADARKEIGPDPRLSYDATPEADARLMLGVEGPMGLTYEPDAPSPAFPNTALLLSPRPLGPAGSKADLQEHFLSVGLRRYLDPVWVAAAPPTAAAIDAPVWIKATSGTKLGVKKAKVAPDTGEEKTAVATVTQEGNAWIVRLAAKALLAKSSLDDAIVVASADATSIEGIDLLHQPLEAGRASLSVFAQKEGRLALLASVDWRADMDSTYVESAEAVYRVAASPVTGMYWTRTSRDADRVAVTDAKGNLTREALDDLVVRRRADGHAEVQHASDLRLLALRASLADAPSPLYVHRHLAGLVTRLSEDEGQPLEIYERETRLIVGARVPIDYDGKNAQLRLLELEVPARPLGAGTILDEFQQAVFDVRSSGWAGQPEGYAVWVRPLGKAKTLEPGWQFQLSIGRPGAVKRTTITAKFKGGAATTALQLLFIVTPAGKVEGWVIEATGITASFDLVQTDTELPPSIADALAIGPATVSVGGVPSTEEWWADVSILRLRNTPPPGSLDITVDWDWMFTGGDAAPEVAVQASELRKLREAQARIISVTRPLPIGPPS